MTSLELFEKALQIDNALQAWEGPLPIMLIVEKNELLNAAVKAEQQEAMAKYNEGLGYSQPESNFSYARLHQRLPGEVPCRR